MATTSEKYRINALAKDFDVKSKDLITILDAAGFAGKHTWRFSTKQN
ncbi:MAG: translation initiation factor IF-2 N-terminal domain-containing protein [Clostridia bacterium]|nr:translation initiation factor IF-2 N-terminal domain-containing protein [Clostridia bacterium]